MKPLLLFVTFIFFCNLPPIIAQNTSCSDVGPCPSVGEPFINDCFGGIEKYLARAAHVEKMHTEAEDYCDIIDDLVSVNAQYLVRSAGLWGNEHRLSGETDESIDYIASLSNFVTNVNNAYDCAGLRRPLIQANIFESVTAAIYAWPGNGKRLIETVPIDNVAISTFFAEIPWSQWGYYFNNPKYTFRNVVFDDGFSFPPNVNSLEGRMWIYQQAKTYIDAGFNSLHLGQIHIMAGIHPRHNPSASDFSNRIRSITSLITKIREYAQQQNKLLVITYEYYGGELYKNNSKSQGLIFDFNTYAARVNEIPSNYNRNRQTTFLNNVSECSGQLNGLINHFPGVARDNNAKGKTIPEGVVYRTFFGEGQGGVSPKGCNYVQKTPYLTYLDFGQRDDIIRPISPDDAGHVFGLSDINWFRHGITNDNCRNEWLRQEIEHTRTIDGGKTAFFEIPIFLVSAYGADDSENWRLRDHDPNLSSTRDVWKVNEAEIEFEIVRIWRENTTFEFSVEDPDNTSIYSWHVKLANGLWLPHTYGTSRIVTLNRSGATVYLRQDNIGLQPTRHRYGTRQVQGFFKSSFRSSETKSASRNSVNDHFFETMVSTEEAIEEVEQFSVNEIEINQLKEDDFYFEHSDKEITIQTYPNPTLNDYVISLSFSRPGDVKLSLFNTLGEQVKEIANEAISSKGTYSYNESLSDLPSGAYLILLEFNGEVQTQKLFKQ